ncbi:uncharacterized protein LOC129755398 isoform X2 [Uranotaenia lowii]|uniref:uncharacterized protein LOC129755398 isoform X2 n=1 Tax=Uranotaenia lowii TaxID=190385 RepID=UPI002478D3BD|nr:uncharacterized protein LOC129755398 isoform X2 [Uranotaenia lowii]
MYGIIMDLNAIWMIMILVHSKGSGGVLIDPVYGIAKSNLEDDGGGLSFVPNSPYDSGAIFSPSNQNPTDSKQGLRSAAISFLAKLRQSSQQPTRQRQRQFLLPAVAIPTGELSPGDSDALLVALGENLNTVFQFLEPRNTKNQGSHAEGDPEKSVDEMSATTTPTDNGQKRAAALRSSMSRRSHSFGSVNSLSKEQRFAPSISVGALTNLGDFFQHLKQNLENLETKNLSNEQVNLLEGQNMVSNLRKEFIEDYPRPAGSAAFLHAIRNYRPSNRIRALVSSVPDLYRGTNYHDPVFKLAGLGK